MINPKKLNTLIQNLKQLIWCSILSTTSKGAYPSSYLISHPGEIWKKGNFVIIF